MSARFDVDFFVIGGGSGGVRAARVAAEHGARVAIAEESRWGGTCVVRGCVPKKLMVYASEVSRTIDDARGQGWTISDVSFDWPTFLALKDQEIARLSAAYRTRLEKARVRVIDGRARLVDAHTIEVAGERVTAANILVATGGRPRVPADHPPGGTHRYVTSDEVFHLPELPKRIGILGAGYIGIEFAHIFRGFGCDVTLVHRGEHVLRGFDPELAREVEAGIARHGIKLVTGDHIDFDVDLAMAAIGRDPLTAGIGLVEAGIVLDGRGAVVVDEWSRTNVPHIYAVGDATARVQLTPIAIREGHAVADTVFGGKPTPIKHEHIPTAVFCQPPLATVGLGEPAAIAAGHDVQIFKARFKPMRYALSKRDEHVLIKVVVSRANDAVLGVHMVGPDAPEIVQTAAIALTMGAKKADLDRTFALHPTTAEELVLLR
ncbi:MAG TPA: FAD-dependent oxidoreductase [Kofleriaceae bacterium]|nr:FAD-dependent oxidoreductase [Kofleriaceae bacterium]